MNLDRQSAAGLAGGTTLALARRIPPAGSEERKVRLDLARRALEDADPAGARPHLRWLARSEAGVEGDGIWLVRALVGIGDLEGARQCIAAQRHRGADGPALHALAQQLRRALAEHFGFRRLAADIVMSGLALDGSQAAIQLTLDVGAPVELNCAEFESQLREAVAIGFAEPPGERGVPGEALPDLLLRLALGLQQAAGWPILDRGAVLPAAPGRPLVLLVPYVDVTATRSAIRWAVEVIDALLRANGDPAARSAELRRLQLDTPRFVQWLARRAPITRNMIHFLRAARDLDIPWRPYAAHVHQIGHGVHGRWMESSLTDATSFIGVAIAQNKMETAAVLRRAGIPVPDHARATTIEAAVEIAGRLGYPVVVKPIARDGGDGVAAGLEDEAALRAAFAAAMSGSDAVLVEKHVDGDDFRLVAMGGRVTWAIERIPGGVRGDGQSTLDALLAALNADPRRRPGKTASLVPVEWDEEARHLAARQGLSLESVPAAGRFVRLRRITNVVRGGMPVAFPLDRIHPANIRLAERAAAALRLDLAGIDFIIPDISRPWHEVGGAINEVNARPSLGLITAGHLFSDIVKWAVGGGDGRIPIVAVCADRFDGEDGAFAAELAARVHRNLCAGGLRAGLASGRGAWVGGELVTPADMRGGRGADLLLTDPTVEAAVIELPAAGLATEGVPFDRCDVVVRLGGRGRPDPFEAGLLGRARRAVVVPPSGRDRLSKLPVAVHGCVEADAPDAVGRFADAVAHLMQADPVPAQAL